MKSTVAIILGIFFIGDSIAQSFESVLNADSVQWNYLSDTRCFDCVETLEFTAYGDTMYNDKLYTKLYLRHSGIPENNPSELIGFIIEDTITSKLQMLSFTYACQDYPCLENTIYDMSLNIGDTLEFSTLHEPHYHVVTQVDTLDSMKVIRFGDSSLEFIEGVGPTREFPFEGNLSYGFSELLCKYHNNNIFFSRRVLEFDTCSIFIATDIEITQQRDINYPYPNPVALDQLLNINSMLDHRSVLKIFTLQGVEVYMKEFYQSIRISPSEFTNSVGVYLYQITDLESNEEKDGVLLVY